MFGFPKFGTGLAQYDQQPWRQALQQGTGNGLGGGLLQAGGGLSMPLGVPVSGGAGSGGLSMPLGVPVSGGAGSGGLLSNGQDWYQPPQASPPPYSLMPPATGGGGTTSSQQGASSLFPFLEQYLASLGSSVPPELESWGANRRRMGGALGSGGGGGRGG